MRNAIACLSLLTLGTVGTASAGEDYSDGRFSGFYIGAQIGETVWDTNWVDRDAWVDNFSSDWAVGNLPSRFDEFSGGIQAGYNWRCEHSLFGIEIDWSWLDVSGTKTHSPVAFDDSSATTLTLDHELDSYGTIRGRAGVIGDNLLLYVTGGAAFAKFRHNWSIFSPTSTITSESSNHHEREWGGVGGVGAELAVSCHFTVKVEALYFTFQENTTSFFSESGPEPVNFDIHDSFWVGRIGVNYNFNWF